MRVLSKIAYVDAPSSDYPAGRIRNADTQANPPVTGSPIVEEIYGDIIQFFQKLASLANITINDLPDNELNDYQLLQALFTLINRSGLSYSFAPSGEYPDGFTFTAPANTVYHAIDVENGENRTVNYILPPNVTNAYFLINIPSNPTMSTTLVIKSNSGKILVTETVAPQGNSIVNKIYSLHQIDIVNDTWLYRRSTNDAII